MSAFRGDRRFIPARAGNTRLSRVTRKPPTVHPRAGGEHSGFGFGPKPRAGSSPRGRGTRRLAAPGARVARFIPARAGNTSGAACQPALAPVHPRAGGEHAHRAPYLAGYSGSSPRGRGTRAMTYAEMRAERFIPARAGNTRARPGGPALRSVHPRAGGEHMRVRKELKDIAGSSPRGRGTLQALHATHPRERFIPARAGNTEQIGISH